MLRFSWDTVKAAANSRKHDGTLSEAASVSANPPSITAFDPDRSEDEDRFVMVGNSLNGRVLLVAYTERGETIRIISARKLTRTERTTYENEVKARKDR
ncbi:MAG: BrnT family toxin [Candidatus Hydrogenedentes bacterium]|nr:BrnT family toxin [Candidatus Hydrogenedentota bacterium]